MTVINVELSYDPELSTGLVLTWTNPWGRDGQLVGITPVLFGIELWFGDRNGKQVAVMYEDGELFERVEQLVHEIAATQNVAATKISVGLGPEAVDLDDGSVRMSQIPPNFRRISGASHIRP